MKLDRGMWSSLHTYLFIDKKLSESKSSKQAIRSRFFTLVKFFENKDFTRANFNEFIAMMRGRNHAASYINNFIKLAKHIGSYHGKNNFQDYTYFKEKKAYALDILTPEEINALAHVQIPYKKFADYINLRQKTLILMLGTTGCRIGEALSLTYADIHASPPYVMFRETKNGDDRVVPIGNQLYELLMQLPKKNDRVFLSGRNSGTLTAQQINLDLKQRTKAVGIKRNVWCHLFRHSFVTTMLEQGVDISDVGVLVGHRDPKTTMRYKNSLLSHYSDVIQAHPLLKGSMTWEQVTKKVRSMIVKSIDTSRHGLRIEERDGKMVIELTKPT